MMTKEPIKNNCTLCKNSEIFYTQNQLQEKYYICSTFGYVFPVYVALVTTCNDFKEKEQER